MNVAALGKIAVLMGGESAERAVSLRSGNAVFTALQAVGADVIAIDLSAHETLPLFDPASQIVYAAGREQVSHVWVHGRCLMAERTLQTVDEAQLKDKAKWWQQKIVAA